MNRRPIRRHATRDPVTPELRQAVLERDRGCVAPGLCVDSGIKAATSVVVFRTGKGQTYYADVCYGRLTLDHVQDGYGRMGKRAPSDMAHLVTLCEHHHLDGWATSHRPELRAYLESVA